MRIPFLIILLCFSHAFAAGQIGVLESGAHVGKILPHSSELRAVTEEPLWGLHIDYSRLSLTQKSWDQCNCYARLGASFSYFNYQNPQQLGSSSNLVFFAEPYLNYKQRLKFSMRNGIGFSYLNRLYDENTNPQNLFFSSPISFILQVGLYANYSLNKNFDLKGGMVYNHISNGGMEQPNKGMNFPSVSLGITYFTREFEFEERTKNADLGKKLFYYVRLFGTRPEVSGTAVDVNERKFLLGLSGGGLWHLTHSNAINFGLELTNDESFKRSAELMGKNYDHRVVGLVIGHNFVFGRLLFNQQMGWYAFREFPSTTNSFYQRYELLYRLGQYVQAGFGLKAHGHVAESMDFRVGVIF